MAVEFTKQARREDAITQFWMLVDVEYRDLAELYETETIEASLDYIKCGVPVERSLRLAETYGRRLVPFVRISI